MIFALVYIDSETVHVCAAFHKRHNHAAEWNMLRKSSVLSLYHLGVNRKGLSIKCSVAVREDLSYSVSSWGIEVDLHKCATLSKLPVTITSGMHTNIYVIYTHLSSMPACVYTEG